MPQPLLSAANLHDPIHPLVRPVPVTLASGLTIAEALQVVRTAKSTADIHYFYVVDEERRTARFTLPSSTVLTAHLDAERTFVFERETDLLAERKETLEADARKEAEKTLRSSAEQGGILKRSDDNVRKTVESLVRSLGFTTVTVEFRGPGFGGDAPK